MKKHNQLGINPSTASHRLVKDILWKFIVETNNDSCSKCNVKMTRETFSIEHIKPWLDSENPLDLYFDLNNISFSHLSCNIKAKRNGKKPVYKTNDERMMAIKESKKKHWTSEKRREHYLRTGN